MLIRFAKFDLGKSYYQHQTVWDLVISKLPVSLSIGLWTFFISYLISIPLGIAKAVRDGSRFDIVSSLVILVGYAIPGFVMGVLLLVVFGGGSFLQLFPLRGLVSDNWESLSWAGKVMDYLWHMVLPITASVIGNFAMITMLTKNSFLEEIRKQYVTTARAKGLNENQVLWKHVFRNAMLPLLTGFPAAFIGAFFAGSLLIETLFSLDGLGLMSFEAVMRRDYPVVFGTLYIFTLIGLFTKLISDIAYVLVDPRIQFGSEGS
jgi:microcin C transport system permease protein